ncbi:MAG: hypothetical protein R3E96_16340 [Planctomycetota bacterium]
MNPKSQIRRTTPRSVKVAERLAEFAIRAGGFGTIFAVGLMMVFLFSVAWPLFRSAETIEEQTAAVPPGLPEVHHLGVDEEGHLAWMIEGEGRLRCLDLDSGETFLNLDAFPDAEVTALATPFVGETFTFGLSDGSLRKGKIGYKTEGVFEDAWPAGETPLKPGESRRIGETFFERAEAAGLRRTTFHHDLDEPSKPNSGPPCSSWTGSRLRRASSSDWSARAVRCRILRVREEENMLTGEVDREIKTSALNAALPARDVAPHWVCLSAPAPARPTWSIPTGTASSSRFRSSRSPSWCRNSNW